MPVIRARQKSEDYDPIKFEIEGELYSIPEKISVKMMERIYELDKDGLIKPASETVNVNLKQLAIFAGKNEDFFVKKDIDIRDARSCIEQIMEAITQRDIKKKKKK
jgi:hypothetical protein